MKPSEREVDAVRIVAQIIGLSWRPLEGNGSVHVADFQLLDDMGLRAGVLEVVDAAAKFPQPSRESLSSTWTTDALSHCWILWAERFAEIEEQREQVVAELVLLESAGLTGTYPRDAGDLVPGRLPELGVSGVATWRRVDPGQPAALVVFPETRRQRVMDGVTAAVQAEIDDLDVQETLAYAPPWLGELFVWLDDEAACAALSLAYTSTYSPKVAGVPPPRLAPGMTGVWAAARSTSRTRPATALWYSFGTRWRRLDPPSVGDIKPDR